jgi:hypothetical protein
VPSSSWSIIASIASKFLQNAGLDGLCLKVASGAKPLANEGFWRSMKADFNDIQPRVLHLLHRLAKWNVSGLTQVQN